MKKTALVVCSLLSAGCTDSSPGDRLVGVWEAAIEEMFQAARAQGKLVPDDIAEMSISVEFSADGSFSFTRTVGNLQEIETGTWKIASSDGNSLGIELITKIGDQSASKEGKVVFRDYDTCAFNPVRANSPSLLLKRKKTER